MGAHNLFKHKLDKTKATPLQQGEARMLMEAIFPNNLITTHSATDITFHIRLPKEDQTRLLRNGKNI